MAKIKKTNAMRILDGENIDYEMLTYESKDGKIDGISVAQKIGKELAQVFKTLVAQGNSKSIYVFLIPVADELDLKKAAVAAGEKKVEMVPVKEILQLTGYIRGGCSPIGMKKDYKTFIHFTVSDVDKIVVSAGKIGTQIELNASDLAKIIDAEFADLTK